MFQKVDALITMVDEAKYYRLSRLCDRIINAAIDHILKDEQTLLPEHQKYFLVSDALRGYFKSYNPKGMPFERYASEPVFVKNIKTLLNALYLSQKNLEYLESIDIREGDHKILDWREIWSKGIWNTVREANIERAKLWNEVIPNAYQASHLMTHLDFSLLGAFLPEYNSLKLAFSQLNALSKRVQAYTKITPEKAQDWIQPGQLGALVGEGVYRLKAEGGSFDVSFLTHLSGHLPLFFQDVTEYLKKLSPDLAKVESSISKEQLDIFEELTEKILVATDRLRHQNALLLPFYALRYMRLIQDIVALGRGIIEQFSFANETSKEVIIEKLRSLKHEYIAPLFLCLDKTEAELMLKPGALSTAWTAVMKEYWQVIATYANKLIDLQAKAPDLLTLNDAALKKKRKLALEHRIDKNKAYYKVNHRRLKVLREFYRCLDGVEAGNSVSKEVLTQLAKSYPLFQRFVIDLKPTLHTNLVDNFFSEHAIETHSNGFLSNIYQSYVPFVVSWSTCKAKLQDIKEQIEHAIESACNTSLLDEKIARDLCTHLDSTVNLPLIPLQKQILSIPVHEEDELIRSHMELSECQRKQKLLKDVLTCFSHFKTKLDKLVSLNRPFLNDVDENGRKELSDLYAFLQPHIYQCIDESQRKAWELFDKKMVQALTGEVHWLPEDHSVLPVKEIMNGLSFFQFESKLHNKLEEIESSIISLQNSQEEKAAAHKKELQYIESQKVRTRANYVFKCDFIPKIPKWIHDQREALFKWVMHNYCDTITNELGKQSTTGVPFVEVEDSLTRLKQPHQLVVIKQILNALYYLELSSQQLANLRENSYQCTYVWNLFQACRGIKQIYELGLALKDDPYLLGFIAQLKEKFSEIQHAFSTHALPYQTSFLEVNHHRQQPIHWPALWYTLQALKVMPGHLKAHIEGKSVDNMPWFDASYSAKKTCLEIEEIMGKSDSYLQLFLSLPQISRLSYRLRDECLSLGQQINRSVAGRLRQIQDGTLTDILIEADKLEISIGLKAGIMSNPVRKILNKFFTELVFQQQLSSEATFHILFSNEGWKRRQNSIITGKEEILNHVRQLKELQEFLNLTLRWCEALKTTSDLSEKHNFICWMQKKLDAFRKLESDNNLPPEIPRVPQTGLEKSIYSLVPALKEDFPNFEFRLRRLNAKIEGEISSSLFSKEKRQHQLDFLTDNDRYFSVRETEQKEQVKRFIELQFDKVAAPYLSRTIGIATLSEEYKHRFESYVSEARNHIRDHISERPMQNLMRYDLVLLTQEATQHSIGTFVKSYYDDYVLLCEFLNQLQFCRVFCQRLSVNEMNANKQKKFISFMTELDKLGRMANNKELMPVERIKQLQGETKKESIFYSRLMNIRNDAEPFTWLWLKQCIEDLLAILHLRKPTPQRHYDNISNSLKNPSVSMKQLYKANGFFGLKFDDGKGIQPRQKIEQLLEAGVSP